MSWRVRIAEEFEPEFFGLQLEVQDAILTMTRLLRQFGPQLGRPRVDTLNGSRHANMKEVRFSTAGGEWRVAFDPVRRAVLLVAGDKSGGSGRRFYRTLIRKADGRFDRHLARIADEWRRRTAMALDVEDVIAGLDPERRRRIEDRAAELIAEEMTLRELRKARALTQASVARELGIGQDAISRLEKRSDILLSTLRRTVEAMGGNLSLIARFPDRPPVELAGIIGHDAGD